MGVWPLAWFPTPVPDYLPEQGPAILLGLKGPAISPDIQTLLMLSSSSVCLHKLWIVKIYGMLLSDINPFSSVYCNFLNFFFLRSTRISKQHSVYVLWTQRDCLLEYAIQIVCLNSSIATSTNKLGLSIAEHLPGSCSAILHFTFHHLSRFDQLIPFSIIIKYVWDRSSELLGGSPSEHT